MAIAAPAAGAGAGAGLKGMMFTPTAEVAKGRRRVFRHQINEIHVGMGSSALGSLFYRGGADDKPSGGDYGSYFADELGELALGNISEDFVTFKREVMDYVLTKPLLVHHKDKIVDALLHSIKYGALGLSAFAKLTYHLCQDLELAFVEYVEPLGVALYRSLLSSKNILTKDVEVIKTIFLSLTGWLRVLSPLVTDEAKYIRMLGPMIKGLSHRSPHVARLSGETLSVAMRKKIATPLFRSVLTAALDDVKDKFDISQTQADAAVVDRAVLGVSTMLFECLRGVSGKWHPNHAILLRTVAGMLGEGNTFLHDACESLFVKATAHANPQSFVELLDTLCDIIGEGLAAKSPEGNARAACLLSYTPAMTRKQKLFKSDAVAVFKKLIDAHSPQLLQLAGAGLGDAAAAMPQGLPNALTAVMEFAVALSKHGAVTTPLAKLMNCVLDLDVPSAALCEFIVGISATPVFASAVRGRCVKRAQALAATDLAEQEPTLLLLVVALYEESSEELAGTLAAAVATAIKRAEQPKSVQWLAWKLADLLPAKDAKTIKPIALAAVKTALNTKRDEATGVPEDDGSTIIASYALKLLLSLNAKETVPSVVSLLETHPLSPSIAATAVAIFEKSPPPKTAAAGLRAVCLQQLRCGHPTVRVAGGAILRKLVKDDSAEAGMLDAAERGESLRTDLLDQNRDKVLAYDRVVEYVRPHRNPTARDLELCACILLGALHVRFRPLWAKAQEGLELVAEADMNLFWGIFSKQLRVYRNPLGRSALQGKKVRGKRQRKQDGGDGDDEDADADAEGSADGGSDDGNSESPEARLGDDDEGDAEDEDADDDDDEGFEQDKDQIESMWVAELEREFSLREAATIQSHFKSLWDLIGKLPAGLISKFARPIFTEYKEQAAMCVGKRSLTADTVIAAFLRVLTKQTAPDKLDIAAEYKADLIEKLSYDNTEVQQLAVEGLKHFKDMKSIGKYEEKLLGLLPHKGINTRLINMGFEDVKAENVVLAVYRLLRPKLWQNKHHTRVPVLHFICSVSEVQFKLFMATIVMPIMDSKKYFNVRHGKYLEFMEKLVENLGVRLEPWLDRLCMNILSHLQGAYHVPAGKRPSQTHREARKICLKIFTKLFRQFPNHAYAKELTDGLAETLRGPIHDLSNAAGTMGHLLTFLATLGEEEGLVPLLAKIDALGPLTNLLGAPNVHIDVYCGVLKVLSAVLQTAPDLFKPCRAGFVKGVHASSTGQFRGDARAWSETVQTLSLCSNDLIAYADAEDDGAVVLNKLMSFLIDSLKNRKLRPSEKATETCTTVLSLVLPKIPSAQHLEVVHRLASLFYTVRYHGAKVRLSETLQGVIASLTATDAVTPALAAFLTAMGRMVVAVHSIVASAPKHARGKGKGKGKGRKKGDDDEDVDMDAEDDTPADDDEDAAQLPEGVSKIPAHFSYDFDTRISAFYKCAEFFGAWGAKQRAAKGGKRSRGDVENEEAEAATGGVRAAGVSVTGASTANTPGGVDFGELPLADLKPVHILPLAYALAYFVADSHQSIRTTAALALKALVKAMKRAVDKQDGRKDLYTHVVVPVVHNGTRIGVRLNDALARQEWLGVYGVAALMFKTTPGLAHVNTDFDFFTNIAHPQSARQLKALATFRKASANLQESSLEAVFLPYFLSLLQQVTGQTDRKGREDMTTSEIGKKHAFIGALLETFAHVATHLSWGRYHRLVLSLLKHDVASKETEKSITNCLRQVLGSFHFLPTQTIDPLVRDDDEAADNAGETAGDAKAEAEKNLRIGDVLVDKIIPAVHRFWKAGTTKDEESKGAKEEKVSLVRLPLAVTILKLLKFIPKDVGFDGVVDSILTELVAKLKTKKGPQRDGVRDVLGDAFQELGAAFAGKLLLLLRSSLQHGYQLHVLGYTVVAMLQKLVSMPGLSAEDIAHHVDNTLDVAIDILLDDNIGVGATDKNAEDYINSMKEYQKNRSLEGLELLGKVSTPKTFLDSLTERVETIFTPVDKSKRGYRGEEARYRRIMKLPDQNDDDNADNVDTVHLSSNSLELQKKIKTILRRCARGVTHNAIADIDFVLSFSADTLGTNSTRRDEFLSKFEEKQSGVKVRLAPSSAQLDIQQVRKEHQQKNYEVLNAPERRDAGFEKREVNSQKRQFGTARRKSAKEGKRRVVIPTAKARSTLHSMDCIDELCISLAWNIIGHKERYPNSVPKVAALVGPIVEVCSGEASDSVVTLALLVLNEVLKCTDVPANNEQDKAIFEVAFDVVERNGEIRSACFRLLTALLLHRQVDLDPSHAVICVSLVRTDLDKKNTFMIPALHLLKAIIVKKVEIPEIYDIIPIVQEKMLHHSSSAIVSQLGASLIARFLTDWRMTEKKLYSHIDFVVQNLQYPVASGRLALLGLLEIVFQRFPDELLKKEVEYFFVPLVHRLMADDERAVKKKAAVVTATLFQSAGPTVAQIVRILTTWVTGAPALQLTALQALNIFLKDTPEVSKPYVAAFYPVIVNLAAPEKLEKSGSQMARKRQMVAHHKENWEIPYHALVAMEAVFQHHPQTVADDFENTWACVSANLTHSHPWVKLAASRLLGTEVTQSRTLTKTRLMTSVRSLVQQLRDLGVTAVAEASEVKKGTGGEVETELEAPLITMAIKNIAWMVPLMAKGGASVAPVFAAIREAAYGGDGDLEDFDTLKELTPQAFFERFPTVRSGALVKLIGVLLVKLYAAANPAGAADEDNGDAAEEPAAKRVKKGSRARKLMKMKREKQKAAGGDAEAAAAADDVDVDAAAGGDVVTLPEGVLDEIKALIGFVYACKHAPVPGAPLARSAGEVLEVLRASLPTEELVRLFHRLTELWREVNAARAEQASFKAAAKKGRAVVRNPGGSGAARKQEQLTLPDGSRPAKRAKKGPTKTAKQMAGGKRKRV